LLRFNGATPFQAWKLALVFRVFVIELVASMGPRLFRRGNSLIICGDRQPEHKLQWGHAFSGVETEIVACPYREMSGGFNGATPFQAWKLNEIKREMDDVWGFSFNGATPFQAWKRGSFFF